MLEGIPDKRQDSNTTSLKFKTDLIEYFKDKDLSSVLEIGTSLGWTTKILSKLFKEVTTMEISKNLIERAKVTTKESDNIIFKNQSATKEWKLDRETYDTVFIDCIHTKPAVTHDIQQSLRFNPSYLVFDDYGLFSGVKVAVNEFLSTLDEGTYETTFIGEPEGNEPRVGKVLLDWEGIIIRLKV